MTLPKIDKSWTLFLDRDGVINKRIIGGYVSAVEEFHFLEGSKEAIANFRRHFNRLIVVTNQQGIGKGIMSEEDLANVHQYFKQELEKSDTHVDAIYHAPQLADMKSPMRKPGPGMGLAAQVQFPEIDFKTSIMVGDSESDIEFGKNLGMFCIKISESGEHNTAADMSCESLASLALLLQENETDGV